MHNTYTTTGTECEVWWKKIKTKNETRFINYEKAKRQRV
jgi:hypothetical protein